MAGRPCKFLSAFLYNLVIFIFKIFDYIRVVRKQNSSHERSILSSDYMQDFEHVLEPPQIRRTAI